MFISLAQLVNQLVNEGWLKTPRITEAFLKIKREDFVPEEIKEIAYLNEALSIGYGQTISQPSVVAFMLELLSPKEGEKILDIGSGSGWTTALLSYLAGGKGKVISIERIKELKEFGENNIKKYNFIKKGITKVILGDGYQGFKEEAPFDKILISASASKIEEEWLKQLKTNGKIVLPINDEIITIEKLSEKEKKIERYPGFVFVPLIKHLKY
ncbi:MAG: protein-L-isoaspartate(D-aspartate) O-methyltransferase [Candidatus Paceibacterota bacterium]